MVYKSEPWKKTGTAWPCGPLPGHVGHGGGEVNPPDCHHARIHVQDQPADIRRHLQRPPQALHQLHGQDQVWQSIFNIEWVFLLFESARTKFKVLQQGLFFGTCQITWDIANSSIPPKLKQLYKTQGNLEKTIPIMTNERLSSNSSLPQQTQQG